MAIKIDVSRIISAHYDSLRKGTNKSGLDLFIFILLPLLIAGVLVWLGAYMSDSLLSTIVSALSIFVGLLLNVVVLLFDIVRTTDKQTVKHKIIAETLANVCFTILLSLVTIPIALTTQITRWPFLKPYTSFVTYFMDCLFIATLLMAVKRVYALFQDEALRGGDNDDNQPLDDWQALGIPTQPTVPLPDFEKAPRQRN